MEYQIDKSQTFDNFYVNSKNYLARKAAILIIENPASIYNQIFLYGRSIKTKEHLINAIANKMIAKGKKVIITSPQQISEENDVVGKKVIRKYLEYDMVIIKNIEQLELLKNMQQTIFDIFNSLYNESKQIVFTSKKKPDNLKTAKRLKCRFIWGLTVTTNKVIRSSIK